MKIKEIVSRKSKIAKITGDVVPEEKITGAFEIVGFNPETNHVYVVDNGNHYYVSGVPSALAYNVEEWLFKTENNEIIDFIAFVKSQK